MIIKKTLSNGIRVVLEPIPYVQSVSLGIWVRAGSVDETTLNSGVSHYIEHMLFKGTQRRSARDIAEASDMIGGHFNAFTSKENTCYYIKCLKEHLPTACDILTDMFMNSVFDSAEMERERFVIKEEIKMTEDSPEDDGQDMLAEQVFRGTQYEQSIIGTPESLDRIDRSVITDYIAKEYASSHVVVSAAGNVDPEELYILLEESLQGLSPSKPARTFIRPVHTPERRVKVKEVEQSHICLGIPGLSALDEYYHAMHVFSHILGGSMSSRLFQKIREEKGLAYSVYAITQSYSNMGIFSIYAGVDHENVKNTIDAIRLELERFRRDGVTEKELKMAKEGLKSGYIFGLENTNSRMFGIGRSTVLFDFVRTPEEVLASVDKVTAESVSDLAQRFCDLSQYDGVLISKKNWDLNSFF